MQVKIKLDSVSDAELTIDDLRDLYNQLHELFSNETLEISKTESYYIEPYWRRKTEDPLKRYRIRL